MDGAWGSGKSIFQTCWVGEHLKREGNTTQTVYFDAFKHDYLTDPLVALTQAISDRLPPGSKTSTFIRKGKKVLSKVAMPGMRVLGAAATAGATEVAGALADAAILSSWKEAERATEAYWQQEAWKTVAMAQFRSALKQLTEPVTEQETKDNPDPKKGAPNRKLVIVVDELDRCRPDYALSLLEIIKHFFNVPGVIFILGVNRNELQNSVRARYGSEIDAGKYLDKHISLSIRVGGPKLARSDKGATSRYYEECAVLTGFDKHRLYPTIKTYIRMCNHHIDLSLRDVERIITFATVVPVGSALSFADYHYLSALIILKFVRPKLYETARISGLTIQDLDPVFGLKPSRKSDGQEFFQAYLVFALLTKDGPRPSDNADYVRTLFEGGDVPRHSPFEDLIAHHLDAFVVPEN